MKFCKLILPALVVAIATSNTCTNALAASALFAVKELQLKNSTPSEADFDRPFEDPLPAIVASAEGKKMIQLANCRNYLTVRNHITGSDNDANYRVLRLQTVPCIALALLKSASIAPQTALPEDFLSNTATITYPATLWPAVSGDERKRLALPEATLYTASQKRVLHKVNNETLELETSSFGLRLTLLVRGDFDHDGWEDAAFRWEGYALQGSYADARLVVLTRNSTNSRFSELPIEKLLPTPTR